MYIARPVYTRGVPQCYLAVTYRCILTPRFIRNNTWRHSVTPCRYSLPSQMDECVYAGDRWWSFNTQPYRTWTKYERSQPDERAVLQWALRWLNYEIWTESFPLQRHYCYYCYYYYYCDIVSNVAAVPCRYSSHQHPPPPTNTETDTQISFVPRLSCCELILRKGIFFSLYFPYHCTKLFSSQYICFKLHFFRSAFHRSWECVSRNS